MPLRDRARWVLAALLSMALLSAPAVWNRFPLLQYDTGGYLARWYEPYLVPSRAVVYGLILNAGLCLRCAVESARPVRRAPDLAGGGHRGASVCPPAV
jgi:hypothetical protein